MVEIVLNGERIDSQSNFRTSFLVAIDFLRHEQAESLHELEEEFEDYTDEDLMDYIENEFDVTPKILINRILDSKWQADTQILDD
ncbi:hypothetical protein ACVRWQ_05885 [Streptococcus phocae subsp. salmonis]|uniref:hypothetical protein n=1 Tax=Streptococcus phocae TaxID=119224 RepID=UPI000531C5BC|nr:hypothetical protein [Streptococcus phocae]KGR72874.1 hypothetical protein NX86_03850 [Streptococcus phocae subsp. salmonis]QBX27819.1 hypothetical protein Javan420_0019 [Streptococcus phage Javan420]